MPIPFYHTYFSSDYGGSPWGAMGIADYVVWFGQSLYVHVFLAAAAVKVAPFKCLLRWKISEKGMWCVKWKWRIFIKIAAIKISRPFSRFLRSDFCFANSPVVAVLFSVKYTLIKRLWRLQHYHYHSEIWHWFIDKVRTFFAEDIYDLKGAGSWKVPKNLGGWIVRKLLQELGIHFPYS